MKRERRATYRLQLEPRFGFGDAARIAGYLGRLGVSHAYLSPCFEANARFASRPSAKLSSTRTARPSASSRSTRCDPMKPAPPVTRTCAVTRRL